MKLVIHREVSAALVQLEVLGSSNASQILRVKNRAVKVLRGDSVDMLLHEYEILKSIDHPNIIRLASSKPFQMMKDSQKLGLQLELGHIDLFHFLKQASPARLKASLIKSIFYSLAQALAYLHETKEIAHNDIKLENILLFFAKSPAKEDSTGTSLKSKLIDFGLASSSQVDVDTVLSNWQNRSPNNLPPEIIEMLDSSYKEINHRDESSFAFKGRVDLSKCDVFQFGLTLFNALFLTNAFTCECDGSSSYQYFISHNIDQYWQNTTTSQLLELIEQDTSKEEVEEIKDLFNCLFDYIPAQRPTMAQVIQHPWFHRKHAL